MPSVPEQGVGTRPEWPILGPHGSQGDGPHPGCGVFPGDVGDGVLQLCDAPQAGCGEEAQERPRATSLQRGPRDIFCTAPRAADGADGAEPSRPAHSGSHRDRRVGDMKWGVLGGRAWEGGDGLLNKDSHCWLVSMLCLLARGEHGWAPDPRPRLSSSETAEAPSSAPQSLHCTCKMGGGADLPIPGSGEGGLRPRTGGAPSRDGSDARGHYSRSRVQSWAP